MYGLYAYKKRGKSTDATNFGGNIPIQDDFTKVSLVSIFVVINIIDT